MPKVGLVIGEAKKLLGTRPQRIFNHMKQLRDKGFIIEKTRPVYRVKKADERELKKATEKLSKKKK